MPAGVKNWDDAPDSQVFENRFLQQILDVLQGREFRPIKLVRNGVTMLEVPATGGVTVSPDGVLQAGDYFIRPKMAVYWTDVAANVPANWSIVAAAKDRFVWNANVDGDLAATGGSTTVNIQHDHTSAAHTHAHTTTHVHTLNGHVHGMSNHTHTISSATGQTLGDGSFSSTDKTGSGTNFDNNDTGHTHGLNHAHGGATGGPNNSNTNSNSDNTTATAPGTSDSTTPGNTGMSLSTTQSILPPYWRAYLIVRA